MPKHSYNNLLICNIMININYNVLFLIFEYFIMQVICQGRWPEGGSHCRATSCQSELSQLTAGGLTLSLKMASCPCFVVQRWCSDWHFCSTYGKYEDFNSKMRYLQFGKREIKYNSWLLKL